MSATVRVRDLKKQYGPVQAVSDVSFEIARGEIFGLLGPNGAGKTTTIECVIGLREPDAGSVEICGIDARRHPRAARQKLGAALQTTALHDKITPHEALVLFGSFYTQRVSPDMLLDRFGLADKKDAPFDSLSGGQRQRLALALAFVNAPELILLDEPTTGLDAKLRHELHGEILRIRQEGQTVLLTTHDLAEAEALCDRIAVIHRGRVAASGATREITALSTAPPRVVVTTTRPLDAGALAALHGVTGVDVTGTTATFRTGDVHGSIGALLTLTSSAGVEIAELHVRRATLEEVFLELTADPAH